MARYYNEKWYKVYWSDKTDSELIQKLRSEWIDIIIWEDAKRLENFFCHPELDSGSFQKENISFKKDSEINSEWQLDEKKVIYTEAIPKNQVELKRALDMWLKVLTYPESLAEVANEKKLVTIAWTHWKSTTTSMTSLVLKNSSFDVNALVWTLLKEFDWKNVYFSDSDYFTLEACEYKRSFLAYKPYIWVITNIEIDHLDYYKDLEDYIDAFKSYAENIIPWWYLVINWEEENSKKLLWIRDDINYVLVYDEYFEIKDIQWNTKKYNFPSINLQVPWNHILFDAKLAFAVWKIIWIPENEILNSLKNYTWAWRRSEIIWITKENNILMSDYGHHPTEIKVTLKALKEKYADKKLLVVFQPHQYNRTLELLEEFRNSFSSVDILIVPDIYYSRDSKEDMEKINGEKFVKYINHGNKIFWNWLENTLNLIKEFDSQNHWQLLILLLWAWNIDDLRYEIETK